MSKGIKFTFMDKSEEVKANLRNISEKAMLEACLLVEAQAKSLAPVGKGTNGTGELRDKIGHNITTNGSQIIGQVGSPLMYAIYVEFGTGEFAENGNGRKGGWVYKRPDGEFRFTYGMKPIGFLRKSFRQSKQNIINTFAKDLSSSFK